MLRTVLALLLINRNRVVSLDSLIDELWGDDPRKSAVTTVQTYIYHLRKHFMAQGIESPGEEILVSRPPGYMLLAEPRTIDADDFIRTVARAHAELTSTRNPVTAARLLRHALAMWSGPAFANVTCGSELQAYTAYLEEQHLRALQMRIRADMALGRHSDLIGELRTLVRSHPLNEWFHSQLILALSRSGRRSEAIAAYQELRSVLRENLGLDPSADVQRVLGELLSTGHQHMTVRPAAPRRNARSRLAAI